MSKILKYKTIQSSSKDEFDYEINAHLKIGWKILKKSFTIHREVDNNINVDVKIYKKRKNKSHHSVDYETFSNKSDKSGITYYSQVIVWKDDKDILVEFYENGQIKIRETVIAGIHDGLITRWYENGQKKIEGTFKNGYKDGLWTEWYENGQKEGEGTYKGGKIDGEWTEYKMKDDKMYKMKDDKTEIIRIFQIARELNISHTDILNFLNSKGVEISSHMSPVDDYVHQLIMSEFAKD